MPPTRRRGVDVKVWIQATGEDDSRIPLHARLSGFDGLEDFGETNETIEYGGGGGVRGSVKTGYKRTNPSLTTDENDTNRELLFASCGKQMTLIVAPTNSNAAGQPRRSIDLNVLNYRHPADEAGRRRFILRFGAVSGIKKDVF